ncbi:protein FAM32A, partial [Lecanoromycetidae sp. Uapishka_2]
MPGDDYTAAVGGGLKLKGVNPSSKIQKHKKKKPKPDSNPQSTPTTDILDKPAQDKDGITPESVEDSEQAPIAKNDEGQERNGDRGDEAATPPPSRAGKTEAELRHEERRRKRLDERLKREGTKTHKERVEELNRYLSNLSEHHDMPRIGPG